MNINVTACDIFIGICGLIITCEFFKDGLIEIIKAIRGDKQ